MLQPTCIRCGKKIKHLVLLDLNMKTGQYKETPWPEGISQGSFEFGSDCAKKVLANGGVLDKTARLQMGEMR